MTDRILHGLKIDFDDSKHEAVEVLVKRLDGTIMLRWHVSKMLGLLWHSELENQIIGRTIIKVPCACEIEINPPIVWDEPI